MAPSSKAHANGKIKAGKPKPGAGRKPAPSPAKGKGKPQSKPAAAAASVAPKSKAPKANGNGDEDELHREVLALGGDEEDWRMIQGVGSDDELDATDAAVDPKLAKELAKFVKGLKFEDVRPSAAPEPEAAEESGEEEEEGDEDEEEEEKPAVKAAPAVQEPQDPKKLVPMPQWYLQPLPTLRPLASAPPAPSADYISTLLKRGTDVLRALPPPPSQASDSNFLRQILTSGTLSDRVSALALLVSESPLHAVDSLETLKGMAKKAKREEAVRSVRVLVDWFAGPGGLPSDRKLKYFGDQKDLAHPDVGDKHLVLWAFEDYLKKYFFELLQLLESFSHDTLPFIRGQAVGFIHQLLKEKPEQEQNLLRLLVNKLGDTSKPIASKTSHHLLLLLTAHPAMKSIIVREVASLAFRPGTAPSAQYYAVITLNQTMLARGEAEVAGRLVELYFQLFEDVLRVSGKREGKKPDAAAGKADAKGKGKGKSAAPPKKGGKKKGKDAGEEEQDEIEERDAKMIAAILTGVNRAMPFAQIEDAVFEKHMNTLFRITHSGTFNTSIQALQLILQVTSAREAVSDRFYRTLYESLLDPRLASSSKQAMYLNLLFRALKLDPSPPRVAAFVKRLLQVLVQHTPAFICGALYLLGQLFDSHPSLRSMITEPEEDDEEHFVDAPEEPDSDAEDAAEKPAPAPWKPAAKALGGYDGRKRDPQYSNAQHSCLWELTPFLNHFHPSVALHARQLLSGEAITTTADLNLHTLAHFLDRFVYRNPKKAGAQKPKGASIMQPAAASDRSGTVARIRGAPTEQLVNSEQFWKRKVENVPVDQLFFHKFFSQKLRRQQDKADKIRKRKGTGASDDEDVVSEAEPEADAGASSEDEKGGAVDEDEEDEDASDMDEDEIWKAMQASMPGQEDEADLMEDSGSDLDPAEMASSSDEDTASATAEEEDESDGAGRIEDEDEDDDELPVFDEEDDDLLPVGEEEEEEEAVGGKRKRGGEKEKKKKRAKLPTFGSYEDYAHLIDADGESD